MERERKKDVSCFFRKMDPIRVDSKQPKLSRLVCLSVFQA